MVTSRFPGMLGEFLHGDTRQSSGRIETYAECKTFCITLGVLLARAQGTPPATEPKCQKAITIDEIRRHLESKPVQQFFRTDGQSDVNMYGSKFRV